MNAADVVGGLQKLAGVVGAAAALLPPGDVSAVVSYAAIALNLAQDFARAGKSPEDLEALRTSITGEWQDRIDQKFPNG